MPNHTKLDEILENLTNEVLKWGYRTGSAELKATNLQAKQSILDWVNEVIGEDENELAVPHRASGEFGENKIMGLPNHNAIARNQLRAEQRKRAGL